MTYKEARAFIDDTSKYGYILGLDTITELLKRLGNPQDDLKFVHIAGTNGKGSILAYVSTILKEAGYRVGRYISPTIFEYRERIQVDEAYITEELSEKKKDGKYQLYFGRYEILKDDVRSISVAVTGKDTFYLQCWVTRYPDGTYDCFPIGGSYMGEQTTGLEKVERIVQLERLKVELEVK